MEIPDEKVGQLNRLLMACRQMVIVPTVKVVWDLANEIREAIHDYDDSRIRLRKLAREGIERCVTCKWWELVAGNYGYCRWSVPEARQRRTRTTQYAIWVTTKATAGCSKHEFAKIVEPSPGTMEMEPLKDPDTLPDENLHDPTGPA